MANQRNSVFQNAGSSTLRKSFKNEGIPNIKNIGKQNEFNKSAMEHYPGASRNQQMLEKYSRGKDTSQFYTKRR